MPGKESPKESKATSSDEKERKAAEKAKRKAEFEAKRKAELTAASKESGSKSKAELRRERNEKQEAQRAAKQQVVGQNKASEKPKPPTTVAVVKETSKVSQAQPMTKNVAVDNVTKNLSTLSIAAPTAPRKESLAFSEIPTKNRDLFEITKNLGFNHEIVHSSFIKLGLRLNQNIIVGSLAKAAALMNACHEMIRDYRTPEDKVMTRHLVDKLTDAMNWLNQCQPLTISMENSMKYLKTHVTETVDPEKMNDDEARKHLMIVIQRYVNDEISCALEAIKNHGCEKVANGDVIMTFGNSIEVQHILRQSYQKDGKRFRVIVVDSSPEFNGLKMVSFIKTHLPEVHISYLYINSIVHVINGVSKVILGVDAIFANGYVMGATGSTQIAMIAKRHNVPVIVCCETLAFSDAVPTDAFVFNERGLEENFLLHRVGSETLKSNANLSILDLKYDLSPPDFVSMVITEIGIFPSTAVSAVIRRKFNRLIQ